MTFVPPSLPKAKKGPRISLDFTHKGLEILTEKRDVALFGRSLVDRLAEIGATELPQRSGQEM